MLSKLPKQKNIPWLGALIDSLYVSLPILSIINFFAILTILYTNIAPLLQEYAPWVGFEHFVTAAGVITVIMMLLVYKFVIPSLWTFRSKQMFGYESKLMDQLSEISARLKKLEEK